MSSSAPAARVEAAAENRYSGSGQLCGLPGRRLIPDDREPGADKTAPAESLWSGFSWRAADVGTAPDARYLDGKRVVLFGPFATFSTKFLKNGSFFDLLSTTTTSNVLPMTHVGLDNFDLVKYLISQLCSTMMTALRR